MERKHRVCVETILINVSSTSSQLHNYFILLINCELTELDAGNTINYVDTGGGYGVLCSV